MPQSYTNLLVHVVFSTKQRQPWLEPQYLPQILDFLRGGIVEQKGIPLEINGVADHVHFLAKVRQDRALSDIIRDVKARSSGWIHRTFPDLKEFAWQKGFGAFSVSQSQVKKVREYIRKQEEHHRVVPFQDEFIEFLKANEVEYDERYLWD
jgi:REP element-mobilizing transposase RayT